MKLLLPAFFVVIFSLAVCGQDEPKVCISQDAANKCASAAAELIEARKVIAEFMKERAASIAEREKAAIVIAGLNELVAVKDRIILAQEFVERLYKQVIELQQAIILKYEEKLAKPKSSWSKFLDALKTIATVATGILIGRGL